MPAIEIAGKPIHVNEEGFLTEYTEWDEGIATVLAGQIGIEMDEMTTTMSAPLIVPNFDSQAEEGRKLAIICSKGNLDMA